MPIDSYLYKEKWTGGKQKKCLEYIKFGVLHKKWNVFWRRWREEEQVQQGEELQHNVVIKIALRYYLKKSLQSTMEWNYFTIKWENLVVAYE